MSEPQQLVDFDNLALKANPFPMFAKLRAESPVYRMTAGRPATDPIWLVTRYHDVALVLKDERFVKDRGHALPPDRKPKTDWRPSLFRIMERNMLSVDPPEHTRLRGLVHRVFTAARVEKMRERVQRLADELLDEAARKPSFDLIEHYALPIPLTVICEVLGNPREDHARIHRWKKGLMASTSQLHQRVGRFWALVRFLTYIRDLCRQRRADPQDDLISALARPDEDGQMLSEEELQGMVVLLLVAGHETAVSLISNGVLALLQHPDQLALLRGDPTLVETATEEILRFYPSIETATDRYAREDVSIAGVTIPRGGCVRAVIASANRDPAQFVDPNALDVTRENNRHLAFGNGIHYCMGAPLARVEGHVAFNTLLARMPNLRLAAPVESLRWRPGLTFRRLEALPVTF